MLFILLSLTICMSLWVGCSPIEQNPPFQPQQTTPLPNDTTAPDLEGIYLSLKSTSNEYITVIWNNDTDHEVFLGEYYTIEMYRDGQWEEVSHPDIAFAAVAIILDPHSQITKSYSLSFFDLSENGTYRIRSDFSPYTGGSYNIYQEFEWSAIHETPKN